MSTNIEDQPRLNEWNPNLIINKNSEMGQLHSLLAATNQIAVHFKSFFSNKVDNSIGILQKYSNTPISAMLKNTSVFVGLLFLCGLAFAYSSNSNFFISNSIDTDNSALSNDKKASFIIKSKTASSSIMAPETIGGVIFRDFQNDGIVGIDDQRFDVEELPSQIIITAYDASNTVVGTTNPTDLGVWSMDVELPVRLEITNLPVGYIETKVGPSHISSVAFIKTAGNTYNYGMCHKYDITQANPKLVSGCLTRGSWNSGSGSPLVISWDYNTRVPSHATQKRAGNMPHNISSTPHSIDATYGKTGHVWGVESHSSSQSVFLSALASSYWGVGSLGYDGIYKIDYSGPGNTAVGVSNWLDLGSLGVDVSGDGTIFGQRGLGGMACSEDEETLYVVNIGKKELVVLDIGLDGVAPSTYTTIPIMNPGCVGGNWRPYALEERRNKLYVGGICDASTSTEANLYTYVLEYDLDNPSGGWTIVLERKMDWQVGALLLPVQNWKKWSNTISDTDRQPILVGIGFDIDGSMIIGYHVRARFQNDDQDHTGAFVRAHKSALGYTMESNGVSGPYTTMAHNTSGNTRGTGGIPTNGKFFFSNTFLDHGNTASGGVAVVPGTRQILTGQADPTAIFTFGIVYHNALNGQGDYGHIFGSEKAAFVTDIGVISDETSPLIGNYIWEDDGNGIQDPDEDPIAGMIVKLYSKPSNGDDPVLAATTTSNANGEYYFSSSTDPDETWSNGNTAVQKDSSYYIVFMGDSYDETSKIISTGGSSFVITTADAGADEIDSDVSEIDVPTIGLMPTICITPTETNYTYDVGLILKPTIIINDTDITCGPVEEGGAIVVTIEGGMSPFTYDWSEDAYDGMTNIQNVPLGSYTLTLTDATNCTVEATVEITQEPCLPNPCTSGIGGTVFYDNNANGSFDGSNENGEQGIKVSLFICDATGASELLEVVYTDPNGEYHFLTNPVNDKYKIVFGELPVGYTYSSIGDDNGTDVQFVDSESCDYNLGLYNIQDVCTSPDLELSVAPGELFANGKLLGPGIAMVTCGTIQNLPAGDRHTVGLVDIRTVNKTNSRPEVNPDGWYHSSWHVNTIGNVYGIDYDNEANIYVTASSHYSHVFGYILGGNTSNYAQAIIKYGDLGGGANSTTAAGTIYKLDGVTGQASVFAQLPQQAFTFSHYACEAADPPLSRTTGPGLGNVTFDAKHNQFFVSNFEDGKIYRLNASGTILSSFDPQTLSGFTIDNGLAGWAADAKPYGLAVNASGTVLYFGTHELNPNPKLYSVNLDANGNFTGTETFHRTFQGEGDLGYLYATDPSWIAISDLEFLPDGRLSLGLRTGCAGQYATSHNHGATFYIVSANDPDGLFNDNIINPDIQYPNDATSNDDGYGGIGIWDKKDGTYDFLVSSSDTRNEEGPHGLILFPHNFTNGNLGFPLQPSAAIPYIPSFNVNDFKGVGGDVEVFSPCGEIPLHVGNYVWIDANGDGIQDPCESPVDGLTVKLYSKPSSGDVELVATTTTNAFGQYFFTDNTSTSETWESGFSIIEEGQDYAIAFCGDSFNDITNVITYNGLLFSATSANSVDANADQDDSDMEVISLSGVGLTPAICFTADKTDFTFDAGLLPKPDLALIQVLDPDYDYSNLKFGDSVKFKITIFNQSLASIDSVEITDYLPAGFTFNPNLVGNEDWTVDGNGNPVAIIPNLIGTGQKDSICIYLNIIKTSDPNNWVNVVEISDAFKNGSSIEDCDSPLDNNPNNNGGSQIDTPADDYIDGDGSATTPDGVAATDQDNVDPATVPICDLALVNKFANTPTNVKVGDTLKYLVIIENQGTVTGDNIEIKYYIPAGLKYLPMNNGLTPVWSVSGNIATTAILDDLLLYTKDTVCIYLEVQGVSNADSGPDSWTTLAEISKFETPNDPGLAKSDIDSTPDSDPTNDSGGNPDDDTNDVTDGDGSGDPIVPAEDENPLLDEDDHDSEIIYLCDVATIIYTENTQQHLYGDTIKYIVEVYNQGNGPITNITLQNTFGEGFSFSDATLNNTTGWTIDGPNDLNLVITNILNPGDTVKVCLELVVQADLTPDATSWVTDIEVVEFEDPNTPGVPKSDIDSTPDDIEGNDSGGNPSDDTNDVTDGNGSGDPTIPSEDENPLLDEDDQDPEFIQIFDLALKKVLQEDKPYAPGQTAIFDLIVYNQGNVTAYNIQITDYLRTGFIFNAGNNANWSFSGSDLVYNNIPQILSGQSDTIQLQLVIQVDSDPEVSDWWNFAEISQADDDQKPLNGYPTDADSNLDNLNSNDNNMEPDDADDNVIDQNGLQGGDEDDIDAAKVIVGYDLAIEEEVFPPGPYEYGDTLTYTITVTNEGGLPVSNVAIYDTIPCGLGFDPSLNADWTLIDNKACDTLTAAIGPGESMTMDIQLVILVCDPDYNNYVNVVEISDFDDQNGDDPTSDDYDSTPDTDPNNDDLLTMMPEDDADLLDIVICDLALVNKIDALSTPPKVGDTVKYIVVVKNQGNSDAQMASVDYLIPNGLAYLPVNNGLTPAWTEESPTLASITTTKLLAPDESDTLCIYFKLVSLSADVVTSDSWTTIAEITSYADENGDVKSTDADSTPDDDLTNDSGGNPDDDTNDELDGNGQGDPNDPIEDEDPELDEDDNDAEIIYICDAGTVIYTIDEGPHSYGDTVKYVVEVHNQGNGAITNVLLQDLIGDGLEFLELENEAAGWELVEPGKLNLLITDIIASGDTATICVYLKLKPDLTPDYNSWLNNVEIVSFEDPANPGVSKPDFDSTPDDDPTNDPGGNPDDDTNDELEGEGGGDPNNPAEDSDPMLDEDDQDVEDIVICDLALINKVVELATPPKVGDTVKYIVVVKNQGNSDAQMVNVDYLIPNGLAYLPVNNGLTPAWTEESPTLASITTTKLLAPDESDTLCIYFKLVNLSTDVVTPDSWTTIAEITSYADENGDVKTTDADSTPDDDLTNDSGGNPDDDTNDELDGNGQGDPNDPIEDEDPELDEDDNDAEIIYICDAATVIYTENEGPFIYGEVIKYVVEVHNQGNGDITNMLLQDLIGDGLEFLELENEAAGWDMVEPGKLNLLITDVIASGDTATICLYLKIQPDQTNDDNSWLNNVEIVSFEDPANPGISKPDFDSTPDEDPTNDPGGNPDDDTNNELEGEGGGDPNNPGEDSDPMLDEDDQDTEDIKIYDLALIIQIDSMPPILPVIPGDEIKFRIILDNQGNTIANGVAVTNFFMPENLALSANPLNAGWTANGVGKNLFTHVGPVEVSEKDTVCIYLEVVGGAMADIITWAEISNTAEYGPNCIDADSKYDDINGNDPGGNLTDGTDDQYFGNGQGDPNNPAEDSNPALDEDDHDVATIDAFDLAIKIYHELTDPIHIGDEVKFTIVLYNQGSLDADSTDITLYIPEGFELSNNPTNAGWQLGVDGKAKYDYDATIPSHEEITLCVYLNVLEGASADDYLVYTEVSYAEDSSDRDMTDLDIDSKYDDDKGNDNGGSPSSGYESGPSLAMNGEDNQVLESSVIGGDEDDQDPAWPPVLDLAVKITNTQVIPVLSGDDVTFCIEVINQGNLAVESFGLENYIPVGFELSPNDMNDWISVAPHIATNTIDGILDIGDTTKVFIVLKVKDAVTVFDLNDEVEITSVRDTTGRDVSDGDIDSKPDSIKGNDAGGRPYDDTNDDVEDSGVTGKDEDDHDPVVPPVFDLAIKVETPTDTPVEVGDTVKFTISLYNQGNVDATNIEITNYIPEGIDYINTPINLGWTFMAADTTAEYEYLDTLKAFTSDTICIYFVVNAKATPITVVNMAEISYAEDTIGNDVRLRDIDGILDNDNSNDKGNDLYSSEDNKLDEFGRFGGDEDDHDQAFLNMCGEMLAHAAVNLSLDENCEGGIQASMLLIGDLFPNKLYTIEVKDKFGTLHDPNKFTNLDLGKTFTVTTCLPLCDICTWNEVTVEDKFKPTVIECVTDTISCAAPLDSAKKPIAEDNCHANLVLIDQVYDKIECDDNVLGVWTRRWIAIDDAGNKSDDTCTQLVYLERTDLDAIKFPKSFIGKDFLQCQSFPALPNGAPTPAFATVPQLGGIDLYPFNQASICNGFVKFEDQIMFDSPCKKLIQRIWTIAEWHCDSIVRKPIVQMFEIKDNIAPVISGPKDMTVSVERFCEAKVTIPAISATDNCSDVTDIYVSTSNGVLISNGGKVTLPVGVNQVIYFAKDACGNLATDTMIVTVRDLLPPVALCETYTTVSLTSDGKAWVKATSIDDGSFDDCDAQVTLEIARVFNSPLDTLCNPDHLNWTDEVAFCCSDVGRDPYPMVALRVSDKGGNSSICMVQVEVQNKEQFNQVICPSNLTIECDVVYDPTNLTTLFGEVELPGLTCPSNTILDDRITKEDLDACRVGTIYRTIDVIFGGNIVKTCNQIIKVVTDNPIDGNTIKWPKDVTITNVCPDVASDPQFMAADAAKPIVEEGSCNLVGMEKSDKIFQFAGNGACYKILRTWTVIDWCGRNQNPADTIPTWTREQVIVIMNTIAPVITSPTDTVRVFSYTPDCTPVPIKLTASATDSCTLAEELQWDWTITFEDATTQTGKGNDASGTYPIGTHSIEFIVRDKCGNFAKTGYVFEVINAKSPTPYCKYGLSTALVVMDLDPNIPGPDAEMSMLTPSFFDNGSYHVCGGDVLLSFSSDIDSTLLILSCDNVGKQNVELWVTDPSTGNQAFCKTFIEVIDSNGVEICLPNLIEVSGRIATADDRSISESEVNLIEVEILTDLTDENGLYSFGDMPKGGDYMLEPHKDGDDMNGVSTLDLVLIQRHILGIAKFVDPYTLIAADVNHDDKVTASDLVGLRKLILGVTSEFENNTSWRFVDKDHNFPVATDPWAEYIKEDYEISYLNEDMNIDFVGVKIGDVNGSVIPNVRAISADNRSGGHVDLIIQNQTVSIGQEVEVSVTSGSNLDIRGLQAAFSFEGLILKEVQKDAFDFNNSNTYLNKSGEFNISYDHNVREVIPSGTALFTLILTATEVGELNEMIAITKDRINAEVYISEAMDVEELKIEWVDGSSISDRFTVGQNEPNPWMNTTNIEVNVPVAGEVNLLVKDVSGKLLYRRSKLMSSGKHTIVLTKSDVPQSGVLIYEVEYNDQVISKKMISIN